MELGQIEPTTWGEVAIGNIVRDKKDRLHTVVDEREGWLRLVSVRTAESTSLRRPAPDDVVDIYVPSEDECLVLLREELGARLLRDIEDREHTIARALTWRLEPTPASAKVMRDHLDMIHGINVDDVLRRHAGTPVNPASKGQKAKALEELRGLHTEAHADPDMWPSPFPHVHTLEPKEPS